MPAVVAEIAHNNALWHQFFGGLRQNWVISPDARLSIKRKWTNKHAVGRPIVGAEKPTKVVHKPENIWSFGLFTSVWWSLCILMGYKGFWEADAVLRGHLHRISSQVPVSMLLQKFHWSVHVWAKRIHWHHPRLSSFPIHLFYRCGTVWQG